MAFKSKMREVYGSRTSIADEIASMVLRSRSSGASDNGLGI